MTWASVWVGDRGEGKLKHKFVTVRQIADDVNILGGSVHTTEKSTEALLLAVKELV
jgi:hypothetical protein